ncbi:MAG: tetratricopeptide repeat protein [Thermoplasmata archaeon]
MRGKKVRGFRKRVKEIERELEKDKEKSKHLGRGMRFVEMGKWEEADREFELALGFLKQEEKERFLGFLLMLDIGVATKTDEHKKVVNLVEYAMKIHRKLDDEHLIAFDLGELGIRYVKLRKYDRAIECLCKAISMFVAEGNKRCEAELREELGNAYLEKRKLEKAAEEFQKTLELRKMIPEIESEIVCHGNLGIIYGMQRKYEKALEHLNRAFELQKKIGDVAGTLPTHINLGHAYSHIGEHSRAAKHYKRAMELASALKDYKTAAECGSWLEDEEEKLGGKEK